MKTKLFFFLFLMIISLKTSISQTTPATQTTSTYTFWNADMQAIAKPESKEGWIQFKNTVTTAPQNIFTTHAAAFGLGVNDQMVLVSTEIDNLGWTHYKFKQKHDGFEVYGSYYNIHKSSSGELKGNGNLFPNLTVSTNPIITEQIALNSALTEINAQTYSWQNAALEQELKDIKNDSLATYFPSGNLAVYNNELVYYFDVSSFDPFDEERIFINALNGSVEHQFKLIHSCVVGIGCKYEPGLSEWMVTTQVGANYELKFNCLSSITTNFLSGSTLFSSTPDLSLASILTDGDNDWETNCQANSAHSHLSSTLAFFDERYGRNGMDGYGAQTIQKITWSLQPNAYFLSSSDMLNFQYLGSSGNIAYSTTSSDIVGHEFTHGIIKYEANLDYEYESGAINESISDIFGYIIENRVWGSSNWLIGEDNSPALNDEYRDMSNPKNPLYEDPVTYLGEYWYTGSDQNDGVHKNSGVMNYWYYLLSDGGSGINDNSFSYNIAPIGYLETADIVYRALSYYLGQTSDYHDTRQATIQATADIYGACSIEVMTVMDAWDAVGVLDNNNGTAQITNTQTWNTNKTVAANISIENGGHLIIDNAIIDFYPNRGITVEPGGILTINGATLTNASCSPNSFWKGIQVKCDPLLWQGSTSTSLNLPLPIAAGRVTITNNSLIENAHIGIASFTEQELLPSTFIRFQGGSVWADNSTTFRNCNESIAYGWGDYAEDNVFITPNSQKVDDCIFECTAPLSDPLYNNKASKAFITKWGWGNTNIDITSNTFRNTGNFGPNQKTIGIQALTDGFNIIFDNDFEELSIGIEIAHAEEIDNNRFTHVEKGIYLMGSANITGNFFTGIPTALDDGNSNTIDDTYGIFCTVSSFNEDLEISGNTFEGNYTNSGTNLSDLHSYGIIAENINTMTQRLSIYKNKFEGLDIGVQSQGDNSALLLKCNEFGINNNPQQVSGLFVYDQIHDIGKDCFANNHPGGNRWFDYCGSANSDKNILVDGNATSFSHWTHSFALGETASNSSTNPDCASGTLAYTHTVCVGNAGEVYNSGTSCSDPFDGWRMAPVSGGSGAIALAINQTIGERDVHIVNLNNMQVQLIDPEIQNQLVDQIAEEYAQIDMYNTKIADLYLENEDKLGYENFLESTNSAINKMDLAIHYLHNEEFVDAQRVLQEIILLNRPSYLYSDINQELKYNLNKEYQAAINSLYIDLKDSDRTLVELSADEVDALIDIKNAHLPASLEAEQILSLNGETIAHHPIKKGLITNMTNTNFDYQLTILPNPTDVSATVLFSLPPDAEDTRIILFDIYQNSGQQVQTIEADELTNSATINTSALSTGIYLVYLQVRGEGVASEQLIVIH